MSGGACEYAYHSMREGEIDKFARYVDWFIETLKTTSGRLDKIETYDHDAKRQRVLTAKEIVQAEMALGAAICHLERAERLVKETTSLLNNLSDIAFVVEWYRSADYCEAQVVEGCVEWMKKRLAAEGS